MPTKTQGFERITISLPASLSSHIEELKKELGISKSEILKISFERYLEEYKKEKLRRIAEMMTPEYESDKKLTEFTLLDGDDFK